MQYVIGIDPGLHNTGWGIIDNTKQCISFGTISAPKAFPISQKLAYIFCALEDILSDFESIQMIMEYSFVNNNPKSSLLLAMVRGSIMTLAGKKNIPFHEVAPCTIKKAVTGNGHASKEQVMYMISQQWPNQDFSKCYKDATDALAIALYGTIVL